MKVFKTCVVLKAAIAAVILLFANGVTWAQSNVVAADPYLSRLMKPGNWAAFIGGGTYYKFSATEALPSQTPRSWTVGATTVSDLTRVGDGQCVDFVKKVSNTSSYSTTSWRKGLDVVNSQGQIITMSGGTAIATFVNNSYSSVHCMIVLRRVGDGLEVAEQNVLTGRDMAKVVSRRVVPLATLKTYSIVQIP